MIDLHLPYDIIEVKFGNAVYYDYTEANKGKYTYDNYKAKLYHPNPIVNELLSRCDPVVRILMRVNGELNPPLLVKSLVSFADKVHCVNEGAGSLIDKEYNIEAFAATHTNLAFAAEAAKRRSRKYKDDDDDEDDEDNTTTKQTKPRVQHTAQPAHIDIPLYASWRNPPAGAKRHGLTWQGKEYKNVVQCHELTKCHAVQIYAKLKGAPDDDNHWNYIIPRPKR